MSENGQRAHAALCRTFSNIPAYEALSERSRVLLDKTGDSFIELEELNTKFKAAEVLMDERATAVENALTEELGELKVIPRDNLAGMQVLTMDQLSQLLGGDLGALDRSPVDDEDDPTYH